MRSFFGGGTDRYSEWLNVKGKSNLTDAVGREETEERTREERAPGRPGVARTVGLLGGYVSHS